MQLEDSLVFGTEFVQSLIVSETEFLPKFASDLQQSLRAIDEVLTEKQNLDDVECLTSVILCECRILYRNHETCSFVEESFKQYF
jgi:hypothetical protein